jgi:F0F1-type ATP synthase assembly protein I
MSENIEAYDIKTISLKQRILKTFISGILPIGLGIWFFIESLLGHEPIEKYLFPILLFSVGCVCAWNSFNTKEVKVFHSRTT